MGWMDWTFRQEVFIKGLLYMSHGHHCCAQLCLTLRDPMYRSLPCSSVHGIFQARIVEWVAISSSKAYSRPKDQTLVSCCSCIGRQILYHSVTWEAFMDIP